MGASALGLDRPPRLAVITNPDSGRNRRHLPEVRRVLRRHAAVPHVEARDPGEVAAGIAQLTDPAPDVLVVNGGDGTVQAVLTALLGNPSLARLPTLALVRGGTTNMTAGDVGLREAPLRALDRLLTLGETLGVQGRVARRPVLRVEVGAGAPARLGMFFGTGAIVTGIRYCHREVHSRGLRDDLAPGICMLRVLWAMVRGDRTFVSPSPMTVSIRSADELALRLPEQEYWLVLASSLERLFLGLRPYWGPRRGAFFFTALRGHPVRPLRTLPPLLWGRAGALATGENGYLSRKVDEIVLEVDGPVTLDGEVYQASREAGPVRVSTGGWASFLLV